MLVAETEGVEEGLGLLEAEQATKNRLEENPDMLKVLIPIWAGSVGLNRAAVVVRSMELVPESKVTVPKSLDRRKLSPFAPSSSQLRSRRAKEAAL